MITDKQWNTFLASFGVFSLCVLSIGGGMLLAAENSVSFTAGGFTIIIGFVYFVMVVMAKFEVEKERIADLEYKFDYAVEEYSNIKAGKGIVHRRIARPPRLSK